MEIKAFGDQVKINSVGDITVSDYNPNVTSITPQQLSAQQQTLSIDKAKYFAFYIDDVDNAQTKPKLMSEAMRKAAYGLGDASDQIIAAFHSDAGVTWASTEANVAGSLNVLGMVARRMDEQNVPAVGRWLVIPPWFHAHLVLNSILETEGSIDANVKYNTGFVGRAFGFDIFMSNNLSTGPVAVAMSHYAMAGTNRAISFAEQIVKMEAYRPESAFQDAVKGLHVYGTKVVDPSALVQVTISSSS
jgi:hypothetical protein